jgi:hypothetical protein
MKASGDIRLAVATRAEEMYAGKITYREFMDSIPQEAFLDEDIANLEDLITHEPSSKGFFAADPWMIKQMRNDAFALIAKLKQSGATQD